MSWRLVEGVPLPDPVGGHPALDFCNTRAGWGSATPKEYLTGTQALALWVREAGLLDAAPEPSDGAALARAIRLREALYRAALGTATPAAWTVLSREAAGARTVLGLAPDRAGRGATWRPHPTGAAAATDPSGDLLVAVIALAAEDLVTSPLVEVVAACPGDGCGWLFADPRRRRRWCSMAVCGNRAKARRHALRQSAPGQSAPGQSAPGQSAPGHSAPGQSAQAGSESTSTSGPSVRSGSSRSGTAIQPVTHSGSSVGTIGSANR